MVGSDSYSDSDSESADPLPILLNEYICYYGSHHCFSDVGFSIHRLQDFVLTLPGKSAFGYKREEDLLFGRTRKKKDLASLPSCTKIIDSIYNNSHLHTKIGALKPKEKERKGRWSEEDTCYHYHFRYFAEIGSAASNLRIHTICEA